MIEMIIIDDETIIRESLKRFIDWDSIGVSICDTADNGINGMASILTKQPDIILTDIRMPGLDGLELIKLLHEQNISSEIIFISAYSNFDYARQAISLRAFDYITKPINEEELLDTVKRCKEKIESHRKTQKLISSYESNHKKRQQLALSLMLYQHPKLSEEELLLIQELPCFKENYSSVICIGLWYTSDISYMLPEQLLKDLFLTNKTFSCVLLSPFPETQLIFLFSESKDKNSLYDYAISSVQTDFFCKEKMLITFSSPHAWNGDLSISYTETSLTGAVYKVQNRNGIYHYKDAFPSTQTPLSHSTFIQKFLIETLDGKQIISMLQAFLLSFTQEGSIYDLEFIKLQFIYLIDSWVEHLCNYRSHDYIQKDILSAQKNIAAQTDIHEVYKVVFYAFTNITEMFLQITQKSSNQLVRNCIAYLHEHFGENITLTDLSTQLFVSPSYLSKIFSTKVGQPFSKYLQEYRIEKSIEYLKNPEYKIYMIASICGFSDVAYFSKAFKASTGMSPNKYRNKNL